MSGKISIAILLFSASAALAQSDWTLRAWGAELNSVAWTGDQFVAVGQGGTIMTSPDGVTWVRRSSGTTAWLYSVTWAVSQLVVVGDGGSVLTSPENFNWNIRNSATAAHLKSVVWTGFQSGAGAGQIVAVGAIGTIVTSPRIPSP